MSTATKRKLLNGGGARVRAAWRIGIYIYIYGRGPLRKAPPQSICVENRSGATSKLQEFCRKLWARSRFKTKILGLFKNIFVKSFNLMFTFLFGGWGLLFSQVWDQEVIPIILHITLWFLGLQIRPKQVHTSFPTLLDSGYPKVTKRDPRLMAHGHMLLIVITVL